MKKEKRKKKKYFVSLGKNKRHFSLVDDVLNGFHTKSIIKRDSVKRRSIASLFYINPFRTINGIDAYDSTFSISTMVEGI